MAQSVPPWEDSDVKQDDVPSDVVTGDLEGPLIFEIEANIVAPDIEERQKAFVAEHPGLTFLSVAFFQEILATNLDDVHIFVGKQDLGVGMYELAMSDCIDGVSFSLSIRLSGVDDASQVGNTIAVALMRFMSDAINELINDPLGEHRRKHLDELEELGFDLTGLDDVPADSLCALARTEQRRQAATAEFLSDTQPKPWWKRWKDAAKGFFAEP